MDQGLVLTLEDRTVRAILSGVHDDVAAVVKCAHDDVTDIVWQIVDSPFFLRNAARVRRDLYNANAATIVLNDCGDAAGHGIESFELVSRTRFRLLPSRNTSPPRLFPRKQTVRSLLESKMVTVAVFDPGRVALYLMLKRGRCGDDFEQYFASL